MRIFVTGAGGFLGQAFCRSALVAGHEVVACDLRPTASLDGLAAPQLIKDIMSLTPDDIRPGTDAIVHFALPKYEYLNEGAGREGAYQLVVQSTVEGTEHIIRLAHSRQVRRFIQISSMTVYPGPIPFDTRAESAIDPRPERRGIYAHSKIAADAVIQQLARSLKPPALEVCIVRLGLVCGPGMGHAQAGRNGTGDPLRATLVSTARTLPLGIAIGIGRPHHRATLLHIRDLTRGLLGLIDRDPIPGKLWIWDVHSVLPPKRDLVAEYAQLSHKARHQFWLPARVAMAGAYALEAFGRMRGRRSHLPYRMRRAYALDLRPLRTEDFWRYVGVTAEGTVRSCLAIAIKTDSAIASLIPSPAAHGAAAGE